MIQPLSLHDTLPVSRFYDVTETQEPLREDEVHIWNFSLDVAPQELGAMSAVLSHEERDRAAGFRFPLHMRRFIVARARLREILSTCLGVTAKSVHLRNGEHGKPYLSESRADVYFNVSHSHEVAVIGVRRGTPLGIDVERIRSSFDVFEMASLCFSSVERRELSSLPACDVREAFFAGWTRKEAYVKAIGRGRTIAADGFDISLDGWRNGNPTTVRRTEGTIQWRVRTWMPAQGYLASMCAAGDVRRVVHMHGLK